MTDYFAVASKFDGRLVPVGDCWDWTGARTTAGYGHFQTNKVHYYAHRIAWELLNGPIPDGLHIDHLCRRPSCCNPSHLEPVSVGENNVRAGRWRDTSLCRQGHRKPTPGKYCPVCRTKWKRDYYERMPQAQRDARNARRRQLRRARAGNA